MVDLSFGCSGAPFAKSLAAGNGFYEFGVKKDGLTRAPGLNKTSYFIVQNGDAGEHKSAQLAKTLAVGEGIYKWQ